MGAKQLNETLRFRLVKPHIAIMYRDGRRILAVRERKQHCVVWRVLFYERTSLCVRTSIARVTHSVREKEFIL